MKGIGEFSKIWKFFVVSMKRLMIFGHVKERLLSDGQFQHKGLGVSVMSLESGATLNIP